MNRKLFILTGCLCLLGAGACAQAPTADFTSSATTGCSPLSVAFKDASTNSPTFWEWDFGNGQTSSLQNPSAVYSTPGTYTVTLIVKNATGENAVRKTDYVTIFPSPSASFTSNLTLACAPANLQFIDKSAPGQGSITSWNWSFGDGSTSTDQSPAHSYSQPGYYTVGLTVTNSGGCAARIAISRYLRVVDGVQPNFTWNQTSNSCGAPFVLNFLDQTAAPGNLTYNWNFGSGAAPAGSTINNPTGITYPANGSYGVTLTVTSSLGCSGTITQNVPLSSGTTVINSPDAACINVPVAFTNGSTPPPATSAWDFGDGTASTDPAPSKTYTAQGTYTVKVTNTYPGCSSSATKTITIGGNFSPAFSATPTIGCQAPLAVQFTDNTLPANTGWLWDFGDGQTSNQPNPQHIYSIAGKFDVKLTATGAGGCSGTAAMAQLVQITAPTISLPDVKGCVNSALSPAATVNAPDGVKTYAWTAPGATPSSSTSATPSFTYSSPGNYSLTLTVTTNGGCSVTQTFNNVHVGTPTAPVKFTATPSPVCGNKPVIFTSTSLPADKWSWSFGDGGTDTGQTVTHIYNKLGPLTVSLTISNNGCTTSGVQPITVNPAIPNFGYKVNCPPLDNHIVTFTDSSLTNPALPPFFYVWNFGDGSPSVTVTSAPYLPPPHTFPSYGSYLVTLAITNGSFCNDSIQKTITLANVTPSFTYSPQPLVCVNGAFILTSTSTIDNGGDASVTIGNFISKYTWLVGTLPPRVSPPPNFITRLAPGPYSLGLQLTDTNGCVYTSAPGPSVLAVGPTAAFTVPAGGCLNGPVTFTDNTLPYAGPPVKPITSWEWNFGDGKDTTFLSPPFTHVYTDTGSFAAKLTVTDAMGCTNTTVFPETVQITSPRAGFFAPDSFYCPNAPLTFTDTSRGIGLTGSWNFGDGSPLSNMPQHTFPTPSGKAYNVVLTISDKYGCQDSTSDSVHIQSPIAAFTIADTTAICTPLQTLFTAQGQYYDSLYWDFGDGTTSTLANTAHFYNTTDTFTAKLFLQGPGGCLDSASRRVLVLNLNNTTKFNYSPLKGCDSVIAQFDITPPGYTLFTVNFADATFDSSQNTTPVHPYRVPGSYTPILILTDSTGCIAFFGGKSTISVLGAVPFFSVNHQAFCDSSTVAFTDFTITNDGIQSKTYNFGDGSSAIQPPPLATPFDTTHFYNTTGTLIATLNVVTNSNCAASYSDTIREYQTPHPIISTTGNLCTGLVQFVGNLTIPDPDTISWAWDFGNGQTANVQNPLADTKPGSYLVHLKASVSFGCSDTTSSVVVINPRPLIKGPAEMTVPLGIPVTIPFTYSSGIVSYNWTPPSNLDCSTCANPVATLILAQEYTVTVTDSNSCTDTASVLIKTICNTENYFLPNTFSPNHDGNNDYFYPRGTSIYNIQSMTIFNRWGQMVFQRKNFPANSATMGWDGTFNGQPAPSDAYVYIVEVICENAQVVAIRGNVTLVR